MASVDLIRSCLDSIRQISDDIVDSIIYLDAGSLEAFQIIGAFPLLLELGGHAICSLENVSTLDNIADWNSNFIPTKKMVVITSRPLSDSHRYILRCLATHQTILQCIIFTSISEVLICISILNSSFSFLGGLFYNSAGENFPRSIYDNLCILVFDYKIAHSAYADSPLGPDAFHEYESLLVQDYEEIVVKSKTSEKYSHLNDGKKRAAGGDHLDDEFFSKEGCSQLASRVDSDPHLEYVSGERDSFEDSNFTGVESYERLKVMVHHFPMMLCPLSARVFVFPSEGAAAEACLSNNNEDSLSPGLPSICTGMTSNGEDVPPGATLTAHFLYNLAEKMDLKMEIFSLGDTSKVIGKMLTDMSSLYDVGRRNRRSAGLLIIDRTLDLLTPCCHGDSFLDRVLSFFPRRGRVISSLAMKSYHSLNKSSPVNVRHAPLDTRIPFSMMLSNKESNMTTSKLEDNIKAFNSGWNSTDIDSEAAILFENAEKLEKNTLDNRLCSLSGCFLSNYTGANYLEALLDKRAKDGILLIKNWLLEALQQEKVPLKGLLGSASRIELHAMIKKLIPEQMSLVRNRGIIQLALAAEIVMSEPQSSRWDAFASAERILHVGSLDNSQSLSSQIRDLINTSTVIRSHEEPRNMVSQSGLLSFQDALLLSMVGYILAGENFRTSGSNSPFSWEEEHSLKEAIVDAILENPTLAKLPFLHGLEKDLETNAQKEELAKVEDDFDDQWGSWDDEDTNHQNDQAYGDMQLKLELRDRVDHLFKLFYKLSGLKWRTPSISGLVTPPSSYGSNSYVRKGLLYKLLAMVLAKYDISGLEYHSSAVGRFLKSGFGRFGLGQAKPGLGEHSVLLIFVVGGINSVEIREAMEAVSESSGPDMEVVIGGTTLLTPNDMYDLLLGSSSYI